MATNDAVYIQPAGTHGNHPHSYEHISAIPLGSAIGAEIQGADLSALSDAQFHEIEDALLRHKMIYFRDQDLSIADQEKFTQRFGPFGVDAYTSGIDGHPNVQRVVKEADETAELIFGGSWHTDSPFLTQPPAISILYGVDVPPYGGDTWWANTTASFAALTPTFQSLIASLQVRMSARRVVTTLRRIAGGDDVEITSMDIDLNERALIDGALHPLVRTHPATGAKSLYACPTYSVAIEGMSDYEARPLLKFLTDHSTQDIFTCRLRWQPGTVAMWDNRSCLHHAFNDHDGFRREMRRTIVEGEVPV